MSHVIMQNMGKPNTGVIPEGPGTGPAKNTVFRPGGVGFLPFSVIFAATACHDVQDNETAPPLDEGAVPLGNDMSLANTVTEQQGPFVLIQIEDDIAGEAWEENDGMTVEADLQAWLRMLWRGEVVPNDATEENGPGDHAAPVAPYIPEIIAPLQDGEATGFSGGTAADARENGERITPEVQTSGGKAEGALGRYALSHGGISSEKTARSDTMPPVLPAQWLKGPAMHETDQFRLSVGKTDEHPVPVALKNGAPETVTVTVTVTEEGHADRDVKGVTSHVVRLQTQAPPTPVPEGQVTAPLALRWRGQPVPAVTPADHTGNQEALGRNGGPAVNASPDEIPVKNPEEPALRRWTPDTTVATERVARDGMFSERPEAEGRDLPAHRGDHRPVSDIPVHGGEKPKGPMILMNRENGHWVLPTGGNVSQTTPESGAPPRGVFIPVDRLIHEAGRALESGSGKVRIILQPPNLGTINMEVVVQNKRVELTLTANHADVQQTLQANTEQLRHALTNQGFQVDQMSILLKRDHLDFNPGGHALWQEGAGEQAGKDDGRAGTRGQMSPEDTKTGVPGRDYGTGIISIFV